MTNNAITTTLRNGSQGTVHGLPASFSQSLECQAGAVVTGPILGTSEILITGNVVILIDPLEKKKPSGTLTVAGATTLNGIVKINAATSIVGAVGVTGVLTATSFVGPLTGNVNGVASGNKLIANFDLPHVKKKGKRIRHIITEGPEAGIYIRGRLKDKNVIELPEYWEGLVDYDSISVQLQPIGDRHFHLNVAEIDNEKIVVKEADDKPIDCFYHVWVARWLNPMDHDEKLTVVYDGRDPDDYPGGNHNFLVGGWDYDRRNPQWTA